MLEQLSSAEKQGGSLLRSEVFPDIQQVYNAGEQCPTLSWADRGFIEDSGLLYDGSFVIVVGADTLLLLFREGCHICYVGEDNLACDLGPFSLLGSCRLTQRYNCSKQSVNANFSSIRYYFQHTSTVHGALSNLACLHQTPITGLKKWRVGGQQKRVWTKAVTRRQGFKVLCVENK